MAVTWTDLIAPQGELQIAVLFPEDTDAGQARLTGYIADGVARVTAFSVPAESADAYVTNWAYHRAYAAKYQQMLAAEATATMVDAGSSTYLWQQINGWKDLADAKLADADDLVPLPATQASTATPATYQASTRTTW